MHLFKEENLKVYYNLDQIIIKTLEINKNIWKLCVNASML